ncbi:hypothetical protein P5V39_18840 [Mycobacteroides abscessus subsp. abscessus]|nr:hypothetical protein [Mycobacteroides abscessus]MDO3109838.1 hypothetical protein [Mycobacteroides abscessus subsp. abscessus]
MDAVTLAFPRAGIEYILHLIEQGLADQCLMASWVQLALVAHESGVIRIAQHLLQCRGGHRFPRWDGAGRATGQAEIGHGGFQARNGVLPRGIQFPCLAQQGSTVGVEADSVDELPVEFGSDVQVADLGQRYGATGTSFAAHLGLNVQALQRVLEAIHDVDHAFHGNGGCPFTEILFGRNKPDIQFGELALHERGIEVVTEGPRAHVDNDVPHGRVLMQVAQQLLEDRPLIHRLGGVTGFDEFTSNGGSECVGFECRDIALGGNRVAVSVNVDRRIKLLFRGHPQQGHCQINTIAGRGSLGVAQEHIGGSGASAHTFSSLVLGASGWMLRWMWSMRPVWRSRTVMACSLA